MSDELEVLLDLLVDQQVIGHDRSDAVLAGGTPREVNGPMFEPLGVLDPLEEQAVWWARPSLIESAWWFTFGFDAIAEAQVDDGLLDVIAPAVAECGVELIHDWHGGPQQDDRENGLRIWINGRQCDYGFPPRLSCMQPLVTVNELLAAAGADRRFYFAGRQWFDGTFVNETVSVALLPVAVADAIAASPDVIEAARPERVDEVLSD